VGFVILLYYLKQFVRACARTRAPVKLNIMITMLLFIENYQFFSINTVLASINQSLGVFRYSLPVLKI